MTTSFMLKPPANTAILVEKFTLTGNVISNHQIISASQLNMPKLMASLAKLMTVMLVWDKAQQTAIDLESTWASIPVGLLKGSSRYYQFYDTAEKVSLLTLIQSALIASSNEAALALACWHSGSEQNFIPMMIQKAHFMGLNQSHWVSSSGLDNKSYTCAQDMSVLAKIFISQYSDLAKYCALTHFEYNGKTVNNTNKLIHSKANVKGLKTGNIAGLGSNLINYWVTDDVHYLGIFLGAKNRSECYQYSEFIMDNKTFATKKDS